MRSVLLLILALSVNSIASGQTFIAAHYYDGTGKKKSGLIHFYIGDNHILFRTDQDSKPENVNISDITAVVIPGQDSVAVVTADNNPHKKYFARPFFSTPTTQFYQKHEAGTYGGTPQMTTLSNVGSSTSNSVHSVNMWSTSRVVSYNRDLIMYSDNNTTYEVNRRNYIDVFSKAFADQPELVKRIQKKEFKFRNIYDLIDTYRRPVRHVRTDNADLDSLVHN
jgi:hypothetical protein